MSECYWCERVFAEGEAVERRGERPFHPACAVRWDEKERLLDSFFPDRAKP